MQGVGLRKGEGFADEAGEALAEGVVEAFDMVGQPGVFTRCLMLFVGNNAFVGPPEVGVDGSSPVALGNGTPQLLAGGFTPPADHTGDDLPCGSAQRQPDPAFVTFVTHERPQLVKLQFNLFSFRRFEQRVLEGRERQGFF